MDTIVREKDEVLSGKWYSIETKSSQKWEVEQIVYTKNRFNCLPPIRDEKWSLLARTDLASVSEIGDGYETIKELFEKLNSITDTQIEPLYEPYYYWEYDEENWRIPTYIIVGDIHADHYGIDQEWKDMDCIREILFSQLSRVFLVEEDEWADPEVMAVSILNEKFGISTIWLENEFHTDSRHFKTQWFSDKRKNRTGIWKWVSEASIDYIWLEDEFIVAATMIIWGLGLQEKALKSVIFSEKGKELEKIDVSISQEEFIRLYEKNRGSILKDTGYDPFSESTREIQRERVDLMIESMRETPIEELVEIYKVKGYMKTHLMESLLGGGTKWKVLWFLLKKLHKILLGFSTKESDIDILREGIIEKSLEKYEIIIRARNNEGIDIVSENMWDTKIAAMVYGKAHIPDLMKQLKEKYNGKVNIYVAK